MNSITLYNGKVKITFADIGHKYLVNGKTPLSVTTITGVIDKSFILKLWAVKKMREHLFENINILTSSIDEDEIRELIMIASKRHTQFLKEAGGIGTIVHAWIEEFVKSNITERKELQLPEDPNVLNGVIAFMKWVNEHNVKFIASEKITYSKKYNYVGKLDAIAIVDGVARIVDFKTSNGIYDEMGLQLSAYRNSEEEEGSVIKKLGIKELGHGMIVRIGKDTPDFEIREFTEHKKDIKAFLGALALKKRLEELKK